MHRYPLTLDESAIKFASDILNETPEKQKDYVKKIRAHFKTYKESSESTANQTKDSVSTKINLTTEDDVLIAFLRGCKYNLDKTIMKLTKYYNMRGDLPHIFADRNPTHSRMQQLLSLGVFVPLRKTIDGRIVIIIRTACYETKEFRFEEILKVSYCILDVCSKICPQMQIYGVIAIFDMNGIGLAHVRPMTPTIIKHLVHSWENYHCRPKQLEFINAPLYINVVLNIFKSFMSATLKERVRVHYGGNQALVEVVNKGVLPVEYGGEDGAFQQHVNFWQSQVQEYKEWLQFDEKFKAILT